MTVRELKDQLNNLDDTTEIAIQTPDGKSEVTKASKHGNYFTFWSTDG